MDVNSIAVVIPVYKSVLKDYEEMSLKQCYRILNDFPIVFVKPQSLDLNSYKPFIDQNNCNAISFEDGFFENVQGYNRLMLSEKFYDKFLDYEFILVYQLDAFVFKNELQYWCKQGYDYIGAPWVFPYKLKKKIRSFIHYKWDHKQSDGINPTELQFYNKVGNGGFSLRRVRKFYDLCRTEKKMIDFYNANNKSHFFNEDVFWSLEVNRKVKRLQIPHYLTAVHFSIEQWPELAIQLTKGALPFGAHALYTNPEFWKPYLDKAGYHMF